MGKLEYLDALKKALGGLPPETIAKTLAFYEQRFIDGLAAGRGEEDIAKELDEPRKIALTLRANAHLAAFEQKRNPVNFARLLFSFIGLAIFNLFMVIPAMVFGALVMALYASAFSLYIAGIAMTAGGLAGVNELELTGPLRHFVVIDDDEDHMPTKISISERGVEVFRERPRDEQDNNDGDASEGSASGKILERAEAVAGGGLKISTDLDADSRVAQSVVGIGVILLGIVLSLMSLVVTRLTAIGIKRYIQMNFALLRGR